MELILRFATKMPLLLSASRAFIGRTDACFHELKLLCGLRTYYEWHEYKWYAKGQTQQVHD